MPSAFPRTRRARHELAERAEEAGGRVVPRRQVLGSSTGGGAQSTPVRIVGGKAIQRGGQRGRCRPARRHALPTVGRRDAGGCRHATRPPAARRPSPRRRQCRRARGGSAARTRRRRRTWRPPRSRATGPCTTTRPARSVGRGGRGPRARSAGSSRSRPTRCSVASPAGSAANASSSSRVPLRATQLPTLSSATPPAVTQLGAAPGAAATSRPGGTTAPAATSGTELVGAGRRWPPSAVAAPVDAHGRGGPGTTGARARGRCRPGGWWSIAATADAGAVTQPRREEAGGDAVDHDDVGRAAAPQTRATSIAGSGNGQAGSDTKSERRRRASGASSASRRW